MASNQSYPVVSGPDGPNFVLFNGHAMPITENPSVQQVGRKILPLLLLSYFLNQAPVQVQVPLPPFNVPPPQAPLTLLPPLAPPHVAPRPPRPHPYGQRRTNGPYNNGPSKKGGPSGPSNNGPPNNGPSNEVPPAPPAQEPIVGADTKGSTSSAVSVTQAEPTKDTNFRLNQQIRDNTMVLLEVLHQLQIDQIDQSS